MNIFPSALCPLSCDEHCGPCPGASHMLLPEGLSSILHGKQEVAPQGSIMAQNEVQVGDLVLHFRSLKVSLLGSCL
ncbi:unnamed protein product [Tetraodon nigroviridis]|uniref:(spotted green pufferfish) hypothetical protein n=1 Tax=Tetraodon nigroviridis TaxID=99883 RepID=Q4RP51_TETNG|nr:unnamed protein product [Tetraodon nigroviridis]